MDSEGNISIAKFTSVNDEDSTIAWEYVALQLAARARIEIPKSKLLKVSGNPVLLMERFDRVGDTRLPYMSVMTLLQLTDSAEEDSCYAEIAEELPSREDRHELFRRVALGLLINNTDDHLRNHGLLLRNGSWGLSPAFDINPGSQKTDHATPIIFGEEDTVDTLLGSADYFELRDHEAIQFLHYTINAVESWYTVARQSGISESECNRFRYVFDSGHLKYAKQAVRRG